MSELPFEAIESFFGHRFADRSLLVTAFTHSSFANVHGCASNERLEFLGNSVLDLVCAEFLFERTSDDEGRLTEIKAAAVREEPLNEIVLASGLLPALRTCGNVSERYESTKVPSDLFEATIGAIFCDGGYDAARDSVLRLLADKLSDALAARDGHAANRNFKSALQEAVQAREHSDPRSLGLSYDCVETGQGFRATVTLRGKPIGTGEGKTKRLAEQAAAREALQAQEKR